MTITASPAYPLAGETVTISQTFAISEADFVDASNVIVNILSVPPESTLATGVLVDDDGLPIATFVPDVPGDYELQSSAYSAYSTPALYGDDAASFETQTQEVNENITVSVGTRMDLPIRTIFGESMTLRLGVVDSTIRTAELLDPVGIVAADCIQSESVIAALEALIDETAATIGPALDGTLAILANVYNDHREEAGVHESDDTTNVYVTTLPRSPQDDIRQVNMLRAMLSAHMLNASAAPVAWHLEDDTANTPIVPAATTMAEAVVLYADLARCYEAHRLQISLPSSHADPDTTNEIGDMDLLTLLLIEILAFIATTSPTPPDGVSAGRLQLAAQYGMKEVA